MKKTLTAYSIAGWLVLAALVAPADSVGPKPVKTPSPVYPSERIDSGRSGGEIALTVKADGSVARRKRCKVGPRCLRQGGARGGQPVAI
ncbi:MAG: hypothetical protein EXS43_04850 [Opitutus sp.]|nr:hypothetical protein [Opitutus sp.]